MRTLISFSKYISGSSISTSRLSAGCEEDEKIEKPCVRGEAGAHAPTCTTPPSQTRPRTLHPRQWLPNGGLLEDLAFDPEVRRQAAERMEKVGRKVSQCTAVLEEAHGTTRHPKTPRSPSNIATPRTAWKDRSKNHQSRWCWERKNPKERSPRRSRAGRPRCPRMRWGPSHRETSHSSRSKHWQRGGSGPRSW